MDTTFLFFLLIQILVFLFFFQLIKKRVLLTILIVGVGGALLSYIFGFLQRRPSASGWNQFSGFVMALYWIISLIASIPLAIFIEIIFRFFQRKKSDKR